VTSLAAERMRRRRRRDAVDFLRGPVRNELGLTDYEVDVVRSILDRVPPRRLHSKASYEAIVLVLAFFVVSSFREGDARIRVWRLNRYRILSEYGVDEALCIRVAFNLLSIYMKSMPLNYGLDV